MRYSSGRCIIVPVFTRMVRRASALRGPLSVSRANAQEAPTGKADLHVHTNASDGIADVRDVLESARQSQLDVLAITDHNTISSALVARTIAHEYNLDVVIGQEVSTRQGHLLALFIKERIPPNRPMAETIDAVHNQGGLVIVPHPYDPISFGVLNPWRRNMNENSLLKLDFDALEVFNACLPGQRPNRKAQLLATRTDKAQVGGSDSHSAATVAMAQTLFPGHTADDLHEAILSNQTEAIGQSWSLAQYINLLGKREMRYAGIAAGYALGLCGATAMAAALAMRSGITRLL